MTAESRLSLHELELLESACTRFELGVNEEDRDIENLLGSTRGHVRAQFLHELIALDYELRTRRGDTSINPADYSSFSDPSDVELAQEAFHRAKASFLTHEPETALPARYKLIEEIGKGGVGKVWRVYDSHSQRTLAIKTLRQEHRSDAQANLRLEGEALLTGSLQHPGIPPIYDFGELEDKSMFFAMKLIEGQTFAQMLKEPDKTTVLQRLSIFEQVAQTVAYAHSQGVLHRDLKPQNVMVGQFREVQVMDWGMAKKLKAGSVFQDSLENQPTSAPLANSNADSLKTSETARHLTRTGDIIGTPNYMSPEQARGELQQLDRRSDVFSLGAILFEVLTTETLHRPASARELLAKAASGELSEAMERLKGSQADAALIEFCQQCLAEDPEQRPADALLVAASISAHFATVQERAQAAELELREAEVRADEERKRRKTLSRMIAAILLVFSSGLAGVLWQWNKAKDAGMRAEQNLEKYKIADKTAQQRLRESRQIVNDYFTEVADSSGVLAEAPNGQELRKTLLDKARDYYAHFVSGSEEGQADEELLLELAQANVQLGWLTGELEPGSSEITGYFEEAIGLLENLTQGENKPFVLDHWLELNKAYNQLGIAHARTRQPELAFEKFERSVELRQAIYANTNEDDHLFEVARSMHNLGRTHGQLGRSEVGQKLTTEAIQLASPILDRNPESARYLIEVSIFHMGLGVVEGWSKGDWEAARKSHEKAQQLLKQAAQAEPDYTTTYRLETQAMTLGNLGMIQYQRKDVEASKQSFLEALGLREQLIEENPDLPKYTEQAALNYGNYGTFLAMIDEPESASEAFGECAELSASLATSHPQVVGYNRSAENSLRVYAATLEVGAQATETFQRSAAFLKQLIALEPDSLEYPIELTMVLGTDLETDSGELLRLTEFVEALESPSTRQAKARALALLRSGAHDRCLEQLAKIPESEKDSMTHTLTGLAHAQAKNGSMARQQLQAAIDKQTGPGKSDSPQYEDLLLRRELESLLAQM